MCDQDGNVLTRIAPSGIVARARQSDQPVGEVDIDGINVPLVETVLGAPEDLPEPEPGVYLIVSFITVGAARAAGRSTADLLTTSGVIRDGDGKIVGCSQFARN